VTIRKFMSKTLSLDELASFGSMSGAMADFLRTCVTAHKNIIVAGGTGSGKTTLLNALSSVIPDDERIVTIEDAAELKLQKPHVVRLESRPANAEGEGAIPIRRLVINALRMRPDRIVVGECRGGEALDMLQAMNTGHDGSLTTVHANSPRDALGRLETLVLMAGMDLPVKVVREQIRSAVHLIVQQARLSDGSRKVISITEVTGMEGETLTTQELFRFQGTGFESTGIVPKFVGARHL
jgi:pilus assembly protein CpaF